jgi:hypothetical protein
MSEHKNAFTGAICQHVRMNGQRCTQPARRNSVFCRFHSAATQAVRESHQLAEQMPILEDQASIQIAVMKVVRYLMTCRMNAQNARAVLAGLRLASMNLARDHAVEVVSSQTPASPQLATPENKSVNTPSDEPLLDSAALGKQPLN